MSGYCAIGRLTIATAPPSVMTIEITDAKIGRSMQKWDRFISLARLFCRDRTGWARLRTGASLLWLVGCRGRWGRCHYLQRCIGGNAERAVDDDPLAGLQSLRDEPVVAMPFADFDDTLMSFRVV